MNEGAYKFIINRHQHDWGVATHPFCEYSMQACRTCEGIGEKLNRLPYSHETKSQKLKRERENEKLRVDRESRGVYIDTATGKFQD